jgi:nucleoid-associated protein YgaU
MSEDAAIDAPLEPADELPTPAAEPVIPCPYLLAERGGWRSSSPSRDHRCTAVAPPAPLALDKQRRLCLASAHIACSTYEAAIATRRARGTPVDDPSPIRWGVARTTPVVDVGVGLGAAVAGLAADRRAWQAIPAIILVVALAAVGLSGLGRDQPPAGAAATPTPTLVPTPSRTLTPTASRTAAASPTPQPSSTPIPTPTPAATAVPASTPAATARTSYRVKSGDTLYGIARAYGTTVTAIKQLNGLTSSTLHVGQVLLIP